MPPAAIPQELRNRIARMERAVPLARRRTLPLRLPGIDRALPGGGIALGALHEVAGTGPEVEHGAAATLFVAALLGRLRGPVLWALAESDLFAPALAAVGLAPHRVIYVEAGTAVLLAMEEGLRQPCLAGVVGEVGALGLTASRRLQLAAEASGALAIALRRSRRFDDPALDAPSAALTRWRVSALPSREGPADTLERPRWRLDLARVRGAEPGSWIVEAPDAKGRLALAAGMADRPAAPARRRAGG